MDTLEQDELRDDPAAESVANGEEPEMEPNKDEQESPPADEGKKPEEGKDDESESDEEDSPDGEPKRKVGGVRKRINELTREKYEAIRRAEAAEAQLRARENPAQPEPDAPKEPTLDSVGYDATKYQQAMRVYARELAQYESQKSRQSLEQELAEKQQQDSFQQSLNTFQAAESSMLDTFPDYYETVYSETAPISHSMAETIVQLGDAGPKVAYYLGTHHDEAARIAALPPLAAAAALGRIAAQDAPKREKPKTKTPEPPVEVGASNRVTKDPEKMSYTEYKAYRERQSS